VPLLYVRNHAGKMPLRRWTVMFENLVTCKYLVVKVLDHIKPVVAEQDNYYD